MCDTRTWVFKLLIVFITIHFSRIQQCHGVNAAAAAAAVAHGGSSTGMDVIASGPAIDTADFSSIDDDADDDDDDDSFERTPSPEDTLSGSQRTNFNSSTSSSSSSFNSRQAKDDKTLAQSSLSSSSLSDKATTANRLPSDEGSDVDRDVDAADDDADNVDDDDDRSNEGFIANQRKFNNEGAAKAASAAGVLLLPPQRKESQESSKRSSILNILQGVDYIGDSIILPVPSSTPQSTSAAPQQSPSSWNGNTNNDNNDDGDDDEDVDEILQPMVMASDKHHYHPNNGGRVMMNPGVGYPIEYNPNRNEESSGSNNLKETPVTNRIKSGPYTSAFEQHKALIRNSRRYGHKTHKKKYKDYLRYNPSFTGAAVTTTTTPTTTSSPTTTISSLRKGILARDRIFSSDDIPRQYYEGRVNYFANTDDDNNNNYEEGEKKDQIFRSYHTSPRQHHNSHHLRSGGRYRHIGATPVKTNRPQTAINSDYAGMNYHHLGSRAMQKHQKELEKKIEEYSQYYAKWPHLAQVEDQLFEDEHADMLYPEEGGGSSPGELVLSAGDDDDEGDESEAKKLARKEEEDANLPPYIKKYRRRNKQLKDLLEGTKPPPSTQAPQWSSSVLKPGPIDGSYQNHHHQHRKHHNHRQHRNHQRSHRHKNSKWLIEDLFEEQRANPNNPNKTTVYSEVVKPTPSVVDGRTTTTTTSSTTTSSTTTLSPFDELLKHENEHLKLLQENKLPAEDVSISRELYDWAIDNTNDQRLDQEEFNDADNDNDEYIDLNHSRLHKWKTSNRNASPVKSPTTTTRRPLAAASVRRPNVYGSIIRSPPTSTTRPINSFVYHRVVESPRAVGAGQTGRKQRLPFVAITDRRLETSRKGMGNAGVLARKDFEQNHFPMP